jgi:2-haloalkanoic acid dehalogenase type II
VMAAVLAELASEAGVALPTEERDALARSLPGWPVFAEVPGALADAHDRGWRLVALSNTDRDLIEASMKTIGVPFAGAIVASEVGSYKPGPGHWRAFYDSTGADAERHVHVAQSHFHDIAPASALGIPTVWINRLGELGEPRPRESCPICAASRTYSTSSFPCRQLRLASADATTQVPTGHHAASGRRAGTEGVDRPPIGQQAPRRARGGQPRDHVVAGAREAPLPQRGSHQRDLRALDRSLRPTAGPRRCSRPASRSTSSAQRVSCGSWCRARAEAARARAARRSPAACRAWTSACGPRGAGKFGR